MKHGFDKLPSERVRCFNMQGERSATYEAEQEKDKILIDAMPHILGKSSII